MARGWHLRWIMVLGVLPLVGAWLAWLLWQSRGEAGRRGADRAGYFAGVAGLFTQVVTRVELSGFGRLAGVWQGLRHDLQAVPDTLSYRKLPVLWVLVTQTEALPVATELHIMARPTQHEVFSSFGAMAAAVALPEGFPADCALRCADASALPPQALIARAAALFADPRVKELVIAPKGLRIVILAEEAARGGYLLFRNAEMGRDALTPARLQPVLDALAVLRKDVLAAMESGDV